MPTSEWKAATSCGSEVMAIRCASTAPMEPPTARPAMIIPMPESDMPGCSMVAPMAIPMPIMPYWLPFWLVSG